LSYCDVSLLQHFSCSPSLQHDPWTPPSPHPVQHHHTHAMTLKKHNIFAVHMRFRE
jgi:hypothetical protein